jgi:hypothetical protein
MSENIYVNWSSLVLEKIFKICSLYKHNHVKRVFPIVAPPHPQGRDFNKLAFTIMSESFHVNFSFSGQVVLEKIFKIFSLFNHIYK